MNNDNIPQSGFIPCDPKPEDYMVGGVTGVTPVTRLPQGDWSGYQPAFTPQFNETFDTLSCTTFSAITTLETQMNYLYGNNLLSKNAVIFLQKNGYIENFKIRFSRRFTAIMSRTTKEGNTFPAVWDCIRHNGLTPDNMLPFGGATFEEYHDIKNITAQHVLLAEQFLSYFKINYEWLIINTGDGMIDTPAEKVTVSQAKQQAPLQMAIPNPSHHATTLMSDVNIFDTYPPYIFTFSDSYPVQYIMRGFIAEVTPMITYQFNNVMTLGTVSNDVLMLQRFLNSTDTPIGNYGKETTYFGTATQKALASFQKKWGIAPAIGYFGPTTMAKVNSFCATPTVSKLDAWCHAIQQHEGYFAGSTSYVNNNPGNLRFANQSGASGHDARNFAVFPTYTAGYQALKTMLTNAATGLSQVYHPEDTLTQFYSKYAPANDNNDVNAYAVAVANAIGVTTDTMIKTLV